MNFTKRELKREFNKAKGKYLHKRIAHNQTKERYMVQQVAFALTGDDQYTIYVFTEPKIEVNKMPPSLNEIFNDYTLVK